MAATVKSLASGQLAATAAAIYTVPSATQTKIFSITYVNTGTVTETIVLTVTRSGGTARTIIPNEMPLLPGYLMEADLPYGLTAGDTIDGGTTLASAVDYLVTGVELT